MRVREISIGCLFTLFLTTVLALRADEAAAQQLPAAVARLVNSETIAVGLVDLQNLDAGNAMALIADWGRMPASEAVTSTAAAQVARRTILNAGGSDLYLVVSLENFPKQALTLVLPLKSKDQSDSVKALFPGRRAEVLDDAVVVDFGSGALRADNKPPELKPRTPAQPRPEFAQALQSVERLPIQFAFALSADGRRVVREMFPQQAGPFGEFTGPVVVDGVQWLSLGLKLAQQPSLELVVQSHDADSATRLQTAVASGLKALSQHEPLKQSVPFDLTTVAELLTPTRQADRLTVSLTEANGGAGRLINDVAKPFLRKAQLAAEHTHSINNLKQFGLAMHTYHDPHKSFPPAASVSKDGRKLLSWRVHLLPFLDQQKRYDQFHLDEPWDSPHNKKLIEQMPGVFASPLAPPHLKAKGLTTYLAPIAKGTILASSTGTALRDITDGTSNTILLIEANADHAVIWTKPDDLTVDFKDPTKGLTGQADGRFRTLFADGSVRVLPITIPAETLRRLMQMNDGEVVGEF